MQVIEAKALDYNSNMVSQVIYHAAEP